jgi:hypothetical protein
MILIRESGLNIRLSTAGTVIEEQYQYGNDLGRDFNAVSIWFFKWYFCMKNKMGMQTEGPFP